MIRNPVLQQFADHCRVWYARHPHRHDCEARVQAVATLIRRHGFERVLAHHGQITRILDALEDAIKSELGL